VLLKGIVSLNFIRSLVLLLSRRVCNKETFFDQEIEADLFFADFENRVVYSRQRPTGQKVGLRGRVVKKRHAILVLQKRPLVILG
jgi:hypothetical protein